MSKKVTDFKFKVDTAIRSGNLKPLENLLSKSEKLPIDLFNPLAVHVLFHKCFLKKVGVERCGRILDLCLKRGLDPGLTFSDNNSLLTHACKWDSVGVIAEKLLKYSIDINFQNSDGWTPIYTAVSQAYPKLVEVLLKRGADPGVKSHGGACAFRKSLLLIENSYGVRGEMKKRHLRCFTLLCQANPYYKISSLQKQQTIREVAIEKGLLEAVF